MKKIKRSILFVLAVGGVGVLGYYYWPEKPPIVTVDGKAISLVEERYFGKINETSSLEEYKKEKGIAPVVITGNSTYNVEFSDLDSKDNYRHINGNEHGWMMEYISNGQTLDARCPIGHEGMPDKEYMVKVSKHLKFGDRVYAFVLKEE